MKACSPRMLAALADAGGDGLIRFRRGWARDKNGPFHAHVTVRALAARRLVSVVTRCWRTRARPISANCAEHIERLAA